MTLQENYQKVRETIAAAAAKVRRNPGDVMLVAVTKNASPEQNKQLIELGHLDFGESRVQQLQQRAAQLDEWLARQQNRSDKHLPPAGYAADGAIRWHMIGHLQRNKVRPVLPIVRMIHSVDSLRLAEEIQDEAERLPATGAAGPGLGGGAGNGRSKPVQILLEVNVAGESTKFGVAVGAALHLAEQIDTLDDVHLVGLMGMAPHEADNEKTRPVFARLRELFEEIRFRKIGGEKFRHLSMGMSNDYPIAIEEGATIVRIGTALFGPER
ncbi:MAG TPA: YggS family pyridoxal phosphate-dependent enzyme [Phycisphaerae bacterium]|nr:YggS family pyridoxal phosphate-dependent enzyme [Phycisphaerae bacterium]